MVMILKSWEVEIRYYGVNSARRPVFAKWENL